MNIPPLESGYARQWTQCRTCGNIAFYDYVPYSLSRPIMTLPCHHGLGIRLEEAVILISTDHALRMLLKEKENAK